MSTPTTSNLITTTMVVDAATATSTTNPDAFSAGPVYLYAFVIIALLVITCVMLSVWRGVVIRRRRRELGLPEDIYTPFGAPETLNPPEFHTVALPYYTDGATDAYAPRSEKVAEWNHTMPVSTTIVETPLTPRASTSHHATDTSLSRLGRLFQPWSWRKQYPTTSADVGKGPAGPEQPQTVVTSVLIAMPSPARHSPRNSRNMDCAEEIPIPEVAFGVYEGPWRSASPATKS